MLITALLIHILVGSLYVTAMAERKEGLVILCNIILMVVGIQYWIAIGFWHSLWVYPVVSLSILGITRMRNPDYFRKFLSGISSI